MKRKILSKSILKKSISVFLMLVMLFTSFVPALQTPISPQKAEAAGNSCNNSSSAPSKGKLQARVGGVALDQAATFLASMDDITGAYYDETLDRIVFVGKTNTTLPEFDKDDLAVAIKAVIFNKTIPAVSIENSSINGMKEVIYFGGIDNTKFGKTLFDADLKFKQYVLGFDVNNNKVISSVPGYKSQYERYVDKNPLPNIPNASRQWITPNEVKLKRDDNSDSFVFDTVTMKINYEPLMENDPKFDDASIEFVQHHTQYFDSFAEEAPIYKDTKQLGKIVAVIKWLADNGIATDFNWAYDYSPRVVQTPVQVPEIAGSATYNSHTYTYNGGVFYTTANDYLADNGQSAALKNASEAVNAPKEDINWTFNNGGQNYEAVAVTADAFRSLGSYNTNSADMAFDTCGEVDLSFNRSYSSFSGGQFGIGRGWSFLPAQLVDNKPLATVRLVATCDAGTPPGEPNFHRKHFAFQPSDGQRETYTYDDIGSCQYLPNDNAYHSKITTRAVNSQITYYTVKTKDQKKYTFEELWGTPTDKFTDYAMRLISVEDKTGTKINYGYDSQNRVAHITDDRDHGLALSYNGSNLISKITDWNNREVNYSYDAQGNLLTVTDPRGGATTYTYDTNNKLATIKDRENNIVNTNTYTPEAKLATQKGASNVTDTYIYDDLNKKVTKTDNLGKAEETTYDTKARILTAKDPLNFITSYTYGAEFLPLTITDKNNKTTTNTYDLRGNLKTVTDPNNKTITYDYDSEDRLIKITDDRYTPSKVTENAYDGAGNLIEVDENGKVTTNTYDQWGELLTTSDPEERTTTWTRDSFGNPLTQKDEFNNTSSFEYNLTGWLKKITDPENRVISYTHDNNGNKLTETNAIGVTTYEYNNENNVKKIIAPNNPVTQFGYNTSQSLTSVLDALNNTTSYSRDGYQNITTKEDALNRQTVSQYDNLNQRKQLTTPLGKVIKWEYDGNGNIKKRIDANNQDTNYTYDSLNRLTKITYPDQAITNYEYDNRGNLNKIIDPTGTTEYIYDAFDRLTSAKDSQNQIVAYEYDETNNLTKITYPGDKAVNYVYDAANRLESLTDWNNKNINYQYHKNGLLKTKALPNGIVSTYAYDNANRLSSLEHVKGGSTLAKFAYERNSIGNITKTSEHGTFIPPASQSAYLAEYFDNQTLTGTPTLTRSDAAIDFTWNDGSPDPAIPNDHYSARWTKTQAFEEGAYKFTTITDDGVRLKIDSVTVIDKWIDQGSTTYTTTQDLTAGNHTIVMEYYENGGGAVAKMSYEQVGGAQNTFSGQYFTNKNLTGSPALTRNDESIDFNWGGDSPDPTIPNDNFSVRWTKQMNFDAGQYTFSTETDDGVRLYVDDELLINKWIDQGLTEYTASKNMTAGLHTVRMEYFDSGGGAEAYLHINESTSGFTGEYFTNRHLSGTPALTKTDTAVDFDWNTGAPDPAIPVDNFSVRWTKTQNFTAGTYQFSTTTDDGVRLYIDNNLVIDKWIDQGSTTYTATQTLSAGNHTIRMEYYDSGWTAVAKLTYGPAVSYVGEYYNNKTMSGSPVLTRDDASIDFDWGGGSPGANVPVDNFSVRWTKTANFAAGNHQFSTTTDDGVRLKIDGSTVIDHWVDQGPTTYTTTQNLSAGEHTIVMEYFDSGGGAVAELSYQQIASTGVFNNLIAMLGLKHISSLFTITTAYAQTPPQQYITQYTYDALNRLLTGSNPDNTYEYTYDKTGNRLTSKKNSIVSNYTYNNDNQLTINEGTNYSYDNNGNQINAGTKTLDYDFDNKLKTFNNVQFVYDGKGNRLAEKVGGTTNRTYVNDVSGDLTNVLIAKDLQNNTESYYLYGAGLISQGGVSEANRQYYLEDGLGNVRFVTDSNGNKTESYFYDPYGNIVSGNNLNDFSFKGEQLDSTTGLYFMRARYYDPTTGRFISRDPVEGDIMLPQSQNGYNYANVDPVNLSDPSGETGVDLVNTLISIGYAAYSSEKLIDQSNTMQNPVNGQADAWRHAEWMGQSARAGNVTGALIAGGAHELQNLSRDGYQWSNKMDMYNNIVGAVGGKAGIPTSTMLKNGNLVYTQSNANSCGVSGGPYR